MENSMELPQKIKNRATIWSRNPTLGYVFRENHNLKRCMHVCVLSCFSHVWLCNSTDYCPPGSSVHWFSRQGYWNGLPCPPPGDLAYPGIKSVSPALASRFFTTEPPGKPTIECYSTIKEKDIVLFAATWMDPEIVILSEISQRKTNITWYRLYVESKKIIAGRKGEGVGKRKINWNIGTDIYTLPYIK